MAKVQHDFVSDLPPEQLGELKLEAEGLRDYGVVYDPNNPQNCALITIWDDLEAAQRAASSGDLVQEVTSGRARAAGGGSLMISPRPGGKSADTSSTPSEY